MEEHTKNNKAMEHGILLNKKLDKNLDLIVGAKIAHYRAIKGLTQTQLAKQAELSTSYISHIEKGVRFPTFKAIVKIAKVLNVSWEELGKSPVTKRLEDLNILTN